MGKRAADAEPVIDLSGNIDTDTDQPDQNPEVLSPISPGSFYSAPAYSELEEFRRIREEQDTEYNAMLENDLAFEVCL